MRGWAFNSIRQNSEPVWGNVEEDIEGNWNPKPEKIKLVEGVEK